MNKVWGRVAMLAAVGGVAALVAGGAYAAAHAMHEQRVKQMKEQGALMGAISKVAKGEMAYSAETVAQAERLAALSTQVLEKFPEGSMGPDTSRAKPEIWSDWAGFEKAAMDFQAAVPALVAAAKTGDQGQIGAALGAVGKTCGGCHKPFRKPKE